MSSPRLDEDDLVLLHHATGDDTLDECSWQEAHDLLNKSVELLEDPGEYLKKPIQMILESVISNLGNPTGDGATGSQDEASSHGGKITTASAQEGY